jgi:hypothetical protein
MTNHFLVEGVFATTLSIHDLLLALVYDAESNKVRIS